MLKISFAGCPGLSPVISAQFTLKLCIAASNREKSQNPYFGGSRSFKVIDVGTTGKIVSSACYDTQQDCSKNISLARLVDSSRNRADGQTDRITIANTRSAVPAVTAGRIINCRPC